MTKTWTGGCACGALRYEISADPIAMVDCQCRDCQLESGTGHASHIVFAREGAKTTGDAAQYEMRADSGNMKTRHFCKTCGCPVLMTFAATPDVFTVRAASLDEPDRYQPQIVTYTARGHDWDHLDPALPKFERMP
ncbi:GFA family protein [Asticcacaulis sp. 201]|uniref:GFA family protein n=1 Tax=Asticcacaulis sp. 201 TaxID=3028787 RepID=UPI0029170040|nr:GFA family protein [Asticcacaulis sp. 201]MDV6330055.1 GFA family protein [Asticcacaulis sp. 201]